MKKNSKRSAPNSAMTPWNAPPRNEKAFLIQKAAIARAAVVNTSKAMAAHLLEAVDIGRWTKKHPFSSTGAAVATGFFVGVQLQASSSGEEDLSGEGGETKNRQKKSSSASSVGFSLFSTVFTAGVDILKEVLPPLLESQFQRKQGAKDSTPSPPSREEGEKR